MEHLVEIIKALAWPVAVVWLGYLFRAELRGLITRLTALKHGETEISFNQDLKQVEQKASGLGQPKEVFSEYSPEELTQKERLYRLAEISPRAAIVEAWTLIEIAALKSDLTTGHVIKRTNPKLILENLASSGSFNPNSLEVINSLRQLRNRASHLPDFAITQDEAERYLDMAIKSAHVIESIAT